MNSDLKKLKQLIKKFPRFSGRTATTDFLTVCYIFNEANENESLTIDLSVTDAKYILGMSQTTIRKSLNRLIDMEFLQRVEGTNVYKITYKLNFPTYPVTSEIMNVYMKYASKALFRFGNGGLNKSALIIWILFFKNDTIPFTEICQKSFVSKSTVMKKLNKMQKLGMLRQDEEFRFSKHTNYLKLDEAYIAGTNL